MVAGGSNFLEEIKTQLTDFVDDLHFEKKGVKMIWKM